MTWLIVVGIVVAVGIALHFGEEARAKALRARKLERALAPRDLGRFSQRRQIHEELEADLEQMTLRLVRTESVWPLEEPLVFRLRRDAGGWQLRRESDQEESTAWQPVPAPIGAMLEAQYLRFLSGAPPS